MEAIEEFEYVKLDTIQAKVEICWNGLNLEDGGLIFRLSNKCYGV